MPDTVEFECGTVRGYLHRPDQACGDGLVLTHGAGGNCRSDLLISIADVFARGGIFVLRYDLPFRQRKSFGPPLPRSAGTDREGLRDAVEALRTVAGRISLGGHSYGGRQASILAAERPGLAAGLLLLSYPLHPPRKPDELRTAHFPNLFTPAVFVHGTEDPFGSVEELRAAVATIPAKTELVTVEHAGHELKKGTFDIQGCVLPAFREISKT